MHILQETPVGYAMFKSMPLEMEGVRKFKDTKEAVHAAEGNITEPLYEDIRKMIVDRGIKTLALSNSKLAESIEEDLKGRGYEIKIVSGEEVDEKIKEIHGRLSELMNISEKELNRASLLLAHSLCREKLKMTPAKNDMIIVQTIRVIDRLDKDINNKSMRIREWYGMHFPEIGEIVEDNQKYLELVKAHTLSPEDLYKDTAVSDEIKECLDKTIGGDITEEDRMIISESAGTVLSMYEAREKLHEHLYRRMESISPNILELLGSLLGARLIAHAGSLSDLSRKPSSTIQVMGAEKALFKAMKESKNTPKYGIIYNSSYVGQVPVEIKGQVARTLASKIAIASRCDVSGEEEKGDYGVRAREEMDRRIAALTQRKKTGKKMAPGQTDKFAMKRPSAPQHRSKKQRTN